jgi:hypothetical protein
VSLPVAKPPEEANINPRTRLSGGENPRHRNNGGKNKAFFTKL